MIPPGPNPLSLRHCSSANDTCAHSPSHAPAPPIGLVNSLSAARPLPLPAQFRLPAHPLPSIDIITFVFPEPQTTNTETEQNPLKIAPRAKVLVHCPVSSHSRPPAPLPPSSFFGCESDETF